MPYKFRVHSDATVELPFDNSRVYLAIFGRTDYSITMEGVTFIVPGGTAFAPVPVPSNAMTVSGADVVMEV